MLKMSIACRNKIKLIVSFLLQRTSFADAKSRENSNIIIVIIIIIIMKIIITMIMNLFQALSLFTWLFVLKWVRQLYMCNYVV